jgi:hypothetical protein
MAQIAVLIAIVVPDTLRFVQGEIEKNSRPCPSPSKKSEATIATKAPAITAGHDAANAPSMTAEPISNLGEREYMVCSMTKLLN